MANPSKSRAHVAEWMESVGLIQADLVAKLGWSKAKANAVWHAEQRLNEDILAEVAPLVNAQPYELLMPPKRAHYLRKIEQLFEGAKAEAGEPPAPEAEKPPKVTQLRRRKAG